MINSYWYELVIVLLVKIIIGCITSWRIIHLGRTYCDISWNTPTKWRITLPNFIHYFLYHNPDCRVLNVVCNQREELGYLYFTQELTSIYVRYCFHIGKSLRSTSFSRFFFNVITIVDDRYTSLCDQPHLKIHLMIYINIHKNKRQMSK